MQTLIRKYKLILIILFMGNLVSHGQNISNRGTDFWVGYGLHQFMEVGGNNSQEMVLYLSAEQPANVTVNIVGTSWTRNYSIPANTVIASDYIPKAGTFDARLISLPCSFVPAGFPCGGEGLFSNKAVHITSDVPIVAYAHIFGSASSGATMLIPTEAWGYSYVSLNSKQRYADNCFSWCYVIAEHDNTAVEITPVVATRTGHAAGVPFTVNLNRGDMYQVMAGPETEVSGTGKPDMTGTKIKSVANSAGECYPIAVFSGSSRTQNPQPCGAGGGDNDNQQCFPTQAWGKRYLTAPTSSSSNANTDMTNTFRILVKDPTTVVKLNGAVLPQASLINNSYYFYQSNTADYIEADKPVMVGQFMTGGTCLNGPLGDPEMMYISPIEQGIKRVGFYRNTREGISVNYLTLIIPTNGIPSLRIDGSGTFDRVYAHPRLPGYSVVVKRWTAAQAQAKAFSDSAFTGLTYGLGSVESYGYNAGTFVNNLNAISTIKNVYDTSSSSFSTVTCSNTPTKVYALFTAYQPTKLVWNLSDSIISTKISPNINYTDNNPVPIDSLFINGIKYYQYQLPGQYYFLDTGSIYIPVYASHPTIENCRKTELLKLEVKIKLKPKIDFTPSIFNSAISGCVTDTLFLSGQNTNGVLNFREWTWSYPDTNTAYSHAKDTFIRFTTSGPKTIKLRGVSYDGCFGDTIKVIDIYDRPTTVISASPSSICSGQQITLTPNTVYGDPSAVQSVYWNLGNNQIVNSGADTAQTVTFNNYGNIVVKHVVNISNTCHSDTAIANLTVYAPPVLNFTYPTSCLDAFGNAQFNGSASTPDVQTILTYYWEFGDPNASITNPNFSGLANPTHNYSSPGNYNIKFSATTNNGCYKDSTVNVNLSLKPAFNYPPLNPVCGSSTAIISIANASVTNGVVGTGYYQGPGTDANGNFDPVLAGAGSHTIWYVYTAAGGCKDSISQTIQVRAKPYAAFTYTNPVCLPTSGLVNFSNSSSVSDGQTLNYNWDFGDANATIVNPNTSIAAAPSHNFGEGIYNIKLTVTTNFGCLADTTIPVTFSVKPSLSFPPLISRCQNETTGTSIATATVNNGVNGSGIYSGPGTSTTGIFIPADAGFGTHNIKYVFTTTGGCVDSVSSPILVRAKPFVNFAANSNACLPTNGLANLNNLSVSPDAQPMTYDWDFGDINATPSNPNTSTLQNPTHNFIEGVYNVRLTATTAFGCVEDTIKAINFKVKPALQFPPLSGYCENQNTGSSIATATVTNGVGGTGIYAGPGTNAAGIFNPTLAGNGNHTIKYVFTTTGGCTDSITSMVMVNPKPDADFSVTSDICEGQLATITDNSTIPAGTIVAWNWDLGDGVFNNAIDNLPFDHSYNGFDDYVVKLVAVSDLNCISDTITKVVRVHAIPNVAFTMPDHICMPNGNAQFSNNTVAPDNSALTYQWNFGDGTALSNDRNPAHIYVNMIPSADVQLIVTSAYGCVDSLTQTLTAFFDKPVADFSVTPNTLCQGIKNYFTDNSSAPNSTVTNWSWNFGDGTSSSVKDPMHQYVSPGNYEINLTVKNAQGCVSDPFRDSVIVYLQPEVDAGWSFVVPQGTVITLAPHLNDSSVVSYLWTPQGDIIDPTVLHPQFSAMNDQVYTLTVTGPGGCFASDTMYVKVLLAYKIPNVFSPNGDGIHDKWELTALKDYPGVSVEVFNRYGQMVYSSIGYNQPWDGTCKGNPLPVGTYYYIIKPRNGFAPVAGSVTILK